MPSKILYTFILLILFSCNNQPKEMQIDVPISLKIQDQTEIIEIYLKKGAWNHHFLSKEWEEWIDKGLEKDSSIALLWQQKALPYWKQKKYSVAIEYYEKAVLLDPKDWLSRLGFLKCIFAKDYIGSIKDLNQYIQSYGTTYEQDHSLELYLGINYLQLNQYEKALSILDQNITTQVKTQGLESIHYLDRYYLAVCHYELGHYIEAILEFDTLLNEHSTFSDAQYYKSLCLKQLGKIAESNKIATAGKVNYENGISFNEDSNKYEDYPYQITWQWDYIDSIINGY